MKKIRVAFLLNISDSWLGGVNYFRNLLNIIVENNQINVEPVIFIPANCDMSLLKGYPDIQIVRTKLMQVRTLSWTISRVIVKMVKYDYLLEKLLIKYNIDIISHNQNKLHINKIPIVSWIPDFQHIHLPELFSEKELISRNDDFAYLAQLSACIILSSYDSKKDFDLLCDEYKSKSKVLQFVVPVNKFKYNKDEIKDKYGIKGDFFYIPNQFWKHKNHGIVIDALMMLRDTDIIVYCSGDTDDYRNKDYFSQLLSKIKENDLTDKFKIIGKIPYTDVQALMCECKALINPSLFEGWSTTVEEAKSMGKRIILSDIGVHQEQNPKGGVFFKKDSYQDLADKMRKVWIENDDIENKIKKNSIIEIEARKKDVARIYREILESVLVG